MTKLLDEAIRLARALPEERQNELAGRIIAELSSDNAFDQVIADTADHLDALIEEALAEDRAGLTREWPVRPA